MAFITKSIHMKLKISLNSVTVVTLAVILQEFHQWCRVVAPTVGKFP